MARRLPSEGRPVQQRRDRQQQSAQQRRRISLRRPLFALSNSSLFTHNFLLHITLQLGVHGLFTILFWIANHKLLRLERREK